MAGELLMNLGDNLRYLRQKFGYTQEEVARQLGISQPAYLKYETGATDVSELQLKKLADIYGVRPHDLIKGNISLIMADVAFAFRKGKNTSADMEAIASFHKIIRNYIEMSHELETL